MRRKLTDEEKYVIENFNIYPTRYLAKKNCSYEEVVTKVTGGYKVMAVRDYDVWKNQK